MKSKQQWKKGFPEEPGYYWFYSYRYAKISGGRKDEAELQFMVVRRISTGLVMVADGQFVFKAEVEEPYYMPAILPELPVTGGDYGTD